LLGFVPNEFVEETIKEDKRIPIKVIIIKYFFSFNERFLKKSFIFGKR
jgi:hypothetical protein